jgi:hypothetical protein
MRRGPEKTNAARNGKAGCLLPGSVDACFFRMALRRVGAGPIETQDLDCSLPAPRSLS